MAFRIDIGELSPPKRLDDGRLIVDARLTRTGVFVYRNLDGTERREYRPAQNVFDRASQDSFALVPVTNDHPPVMINADNARQYTVGQVSEGIRRDGNHLSARIVINDAATIRQMEAGKRDVSCGYACDLDETPGVSPEGERYDAVQTNIRGNHLAIVSSGRAGSARVRMDADDAYQVPTTSGSGRSSEVIVPRADSKESHVDELQKALAALAEQTKRADAEKARADKAIEDHKALELKLVAAESDRATEAKRADAEKARADDAVKARKDADDAYDARVNARVELVGAAVAALGRNDSGEVLSADGKTTLDLAKMTDREIRCAVVLKLDGNTIDVKRSDDAVAYAFDLAIDRAKKAGDALGAVRQNIVAGRADASAHGGDAEARAREASKARLVSAWKGTK